MSEKLNEQMKSNPEFAKRFEEMMSEMREDKMKLEISNSDAKDIMNTLDNIFSTEPIVYDPEEYAMGLTFDFSIIELEKVINIYFITKGIKVKCHKLMKNANDTNWVEKKIPYIFTVKEDK